MVDVGASGDGQDIAFAGVWGDSAVYKTRDSLYVVLFNIILGMHRHRSGSQLLASGHVALVFVRGVALGSVSVEW